MLACQPDIKLCTKTRHGDVQHMLATVNGYALSMPVRMTVDKQGCPQPEVDAFGYVYALPGGRKINLNGDIT